MSFAVVFLGMVTVAAPLTAPPLGNAASFAVAGASLTSSGATTIAGNAGGKLTGAPAFTVGGLRNDLASRALADAAIAYDRLAAAGPCAPLVDHAPAGVYCASSLTGTLTLDGDAGAVWIIRAPQGLTTSAGSAVRVIHGGRDANVFWQSDGPVTLGARTVFAGNILARGAIALGAKASLSGRALSLGGAVTLDSNSVSICCPALVVSDTLPRAAVKVAYSAAVTASGGKSPYRFELLSGALPPGMILASDGTLSGAPAMSGHFAFTVVATDAQGCSAAAPEVIDVCPLTLPSTIPHGAVNLPYTPTIGTAGYEFELIGGPDWLTLSKDGTFCGTPRKSGVFHVTVRAVDRLSGCTGSADYRLVICGMTIRLEQPLPARFCSPTSARLIADGAIGSARFSGQLPDGISVTEDGGISVLPNGAGAVTFTVRATDEESCPAEASFAIDVGPPTLLTIAPETLRPATVGEQYDQQLDAVGGTPPPRFRSDPDPPSADLTLNHNGLLSGIPKAPDDFTFTVFATDDACGFGMKKYTLRVCGELVLPPNDLLPATFGVPYRRQLTATGGKGRYQFTGETQRMPVWLKLSPDGLLEGTPTSGPITPFMAVNPLGPFQVCVTDSLFGCPATCEKYDLLLRVCPFSVTITRTALPDGTAGTEYETTTITATGGPAPRRFTVVSGTLPPGLTLSADGVLAGTPSTPGKFSFGVVATEPPGCSSAPQDYTITIAGGLD